MSGLNCKANDKYCLALNDSSHWLFRRDLTMYWAFVNLCGINTCARWPLYVHTCISVMRLALGRKEHLGHAAENRPLTLKWRGKAKLPCESIFSLVVPAFLSLLAVSSHFLCQPNQPRRKIWHWTLLDHICYCISLKHTARWNFSSDTADKQLPGNFQHSLNCAGLYICLGRLLYLMFQQWSIWTHSVYFIPYFFYRLSFLFLSIVSLFTLLNLVS